MYCLVSQSNREGILEERPANTEGPGTVVMQASHFPNGLFLRWLASSWIVLLHLRNAQGKET